MERVWRPFGGGTMWSGACGGHLKDHVEWSVCRPFEGPCGVERVEAIWRGGSCGVERVEAI